MTNALKKTAVRLLRRVPGWWAPGFRTVPHEFRMARHYFVVGCGHSGTSILTALLDNHPAIQAVPGESRLFVHNRFWHNRAILRQWAALWSPGQRLVEKTPSHVHRTERIKRVFPNAIIVGIARNPLDNVASMTERVNNISRAIHRYNRDNLALLSAKQQGNVNIIINYETLIDYPRDTMTMILEYGGLTFDDDVLSTQGRKPREWYADTRSNTLPPEYTPNSHALSRNWQINQPLFDSRGKYRKILDESVVPRIIEDTADVAGRLGYDSKNGEQSVMQPFGALR